MPSERFAYYIDQCKIKHETTKVFSGKGVLKHRARLLEIAREIGATSALDYGAGKCGAYPHISDVDGMTIEQALGFTVTKYDPAVPDISAKPEGKFDLCFCTDVLEHIPGEDIDYVLDDIAGHASKAVFLTIATYPAKKELPNGENAHVTIKPSQWWVARIAKMKRNHPALRVESLIA